MRIEHVYRYPVKGLTAEALDEIEVSTGACLPWDRAFALAQGDAPLDPAAPVWLPKQNFMCLMANAKAALLRSSFDPATAMLVIRAPDGQEIAENALRPDGQARLAAFLTAWLGEDARGIPNFVHGGQHAFTDEDEKVLSLINLASVEDYAARAGCAREPLRFRANIYFTGARPWSEFDWIGRELVVGTARVQVARRIPRCPATQVNPATAERDANPVRELRAIYGHGDLGVFARVVEGGRIAPGAALELLPA